MDHWIKKLKEDAYFQEFQKHIFEKIHELDTIDDLQKLSNERAGEEVKARGLAKEKLLEILHPFIAFAEKQEPTEENIRKTKEKFAL